MVAMEHFVQATVRICRGAQSADKTIDKVAKVVHCLVCEERSVVPNSNHPIDAASVQCLACDCLDNTAASSAAPPQRGRNRILLGPVWCGKIFDANFVAKMEGISNRDGEKEKIAICAKTKEILTLLKAEAVCSSNVSSTGAEKKTTTTISSEDDSKSNGEKDEEVSPKRRRLGSSSGHFADPASASASTGSIKTSTSGASDERVSSDALRELSEGEPVFYYSNHLHVPKGRILSLYRSVLSVKGNLFVRWSLCRVIRLCFVEKS